MQSIGYQVGSGNLIGLPFQTLEDIADDILLCKKLDVDMASFSPFIPSPYTPYRNKRPVDFTLALKVLAVARIVLRNVHIPATTALASMDKEGREKGLLAGANVIMPNFTPAAFSSKYQIYPNKKNDFNIETTLSEIEDILRSMDLEIESSRGDFLKRAHIFESTP